MVGKRNGGAIEGMMRERSIMLKVENEKIMIRGENWTEGKITNEEGRDIGRREEKQNKKQKGQKRI
jgi:hypothetical protein